MRYFPFISIFWTVLLSIVIYQKISNDAFFYQRCEDVWVKVYSSPWYPRIEFTDSPYFPGWGTWLHPDRLEIRLTIPERLRTVLKPSRHLTKRELLYKLGGNGPWVQKTTQGSPDNRPPQSCKVEQVHMLSRHSERYPTYTAGSRHLDLVKRLKALNTPLNGSLSFFNEWNYFTNNSENDFEQLTSTGPYAGTLGSFTTGIRFRTRYGHMLPKSGTKKTTRLWASDSKRVIDTARYFAAGLFGIDWEKDDKAEVEVIPETMDRYTDTLTPGDTCLQYIEDTVLGHDCGRNMLEKFQNAYIPPIARRLIDEEGNEAVGEFTNLEIYSMQETCGFETLVRGTSPWCDVFTSRDWDHFEYARDLIHFYRAGPGNPYAGAMGWLWLNATSTLLEIGPKVGKMFFSFVHDGDIAPMLTALNIFDDPKYGKYLPVTRIAEDRVWRMSTVLPMGGRISFERLHCKANNEGEEFFVRININDDIVQLPNCHTGPGSSCPLDHFVKIVHERRDQVGKFGETCGTEEKEETGLTFLRQPVYDSLEDDVRSSSSNLYSVIKSTDQNRQNC
ncbi:acid phosphatase, putative [Talaromyces stipitatus ATCC 10500]|uniref:Acid phosphatase, putative n=1 Tax=Talaromyces stipitatus (strain ATCC 10500 / CBS 375.48 / QM 6759 / NRRL 1006) TaxID=441959 RepID=B8MKL4_TALSN|nr:acid phosphatase, putative [Talaromyces stipitatus ATCC 10500]EED15369.1 acid phosphatase, putative [Talaromyces stipitatus ATCC 10500]